MNTDGPMLGSTALLSCGQVVRIWNIVLAYFRMWAMHEDSNTVGSTHCEGAAEMQNSVCFRIHSLCSSQN